MSTPFTRRTTSRPTVTASAVAEIEARDAAAVAPDRPTSRPVFRSAPNPFPHRLSVDVDDAMYRDIRVAAAEDGSSIVELVRAAISDRLTHRRGSD